MSWKSRLSRRMIVQSGKASTVLDKLDNVISGWEAWDISGRSFVRA